MRHGQDTTLPYEIDYYLPEPDDKRTKGYSPTYVKNMLATANLVDPYMSKSK
jgi:hypothetical protein